MGRSNKIRPLLGAVRAAVRRPPGLCSRGGPLPDPGRLWRLEQLLRQIRVLFPQNQLGIVPGLGNVTPKLVVFQTVHQLCGLL